MSSACGFVVLAVLSGGPGRTGRGGVTRPGESEGGGGGGGGGGREGGREGEGEGGREVKSNH